MGDAESDQAQITAVVQNYFEGMMYGDKLKLQMAFHEESFIIGHFDGELSWMSRDDFADFCEVESTLNDGDSFEALVEAIDVAGDAASAKVRNKELGTWYTDFLSLLRIEKQWRIVNKIYFAHPEV